MATVTGLTASRTLEIEAGLIVSGAVDGSGHLILTKHDGGTIDVGSVVTSIPAASDTVAGVVELATNAETSTGTDATRAVTPASLAAAVPTATTSVQGRVQLATSAETITGTDIVKATTAKGVADAINSAVPSATTSAQGKVELATTAETQAGTDTTRAVTPAGLIATVATTSQKGVVQLATSAEVTTGTDTAKAATSAGVAAAISASATPSASTSTAGKVQLATNAEVQAGTNTAKAVVPSSLASYAARNDLGIYVPPGWGQFWKPKRNNAASAQAVIAAVGSSSTQGLYSSNLLTAPFVSKIMTDLQTNYGDGGSGYFHTARSLTFLGASTTANAWNAISGNFCTVTNPGNWNIGNTYGPGANYIYTQTVGDTITFIIRGTKARIYTIGGAGRSNWSYTVDGGSSTSVTDIGGGSSQVQVTSINGLSSGSHTIVMTKAGSAGTSMAVCGVTGENNTGIVVNNYGMSGAKSGDYLGLGTSTVYEPIRWSGGPDYPADLLIYALGANDANTGYTGDSWATNLRQFLQVVKDGSTVGGTPATGTTDVLIVMQHIGTYDSTNLKWQDYVSRARGIAEAYGAALVNFWSLGRNSWNYANSLGYWGNSAASGGGAGTDTIHMSDAGHTALANAILPILKS